MVVVDHLEERLDAITASTLLLAHSLGDRSWISVDASHQSMAIAFGIGALVLVLEDHCLAAGVLALQQQNHLVWFHNFSHLGTGEIWNDTKRNGRERDRQKESQAEIFSRKKEGSISEVLLREKKKSRALARLVRFANVLHAGAAHRRRARGRLF